MVAGRSNLYERSHPAGVSAGSNVVVRRRLSRDGADNPGGADR